MKRLAFVLSGALLVLLLSAAPAMAGAPLATQPGPPVNTAVFGVGGDGSWMEFPDGTWDSEVDHPALTPVPRGYTAVLMSGWITMTLGLADSAPDMLQYQLSLDGSVVTTFAQSRLYWTGPFPMEPSTDFGPFNPNIGAGLWANSLFLPIARPAAGTFALGVSEWLKHTTTDLIVPLDSPSPHPVMYPVILTDYDTQPIVFK